MGVEALVEVHTPNELEFALSKGATIFLINMWDRATGILYPDQVNNTFNTDSIALFSNTNPSIIPFLT